MPPPQEILAIDEDEKEEKEEEEEKERKERRMKYSTPTSNVLDPPLTAVKAFRGGRWRVSKRCALEAAATPFSSTIAWAATTPEARWGRRGGIEGSEESSRNKGTGCFL